MRLMLAQPDYFFGYFQTFIAFASPPPQKKKKISAQHRIRSVLS
jgi:hypothetical protein